MVNKFSELKSNRGGKGEDTHTNKQDLQLVTSFAPFPCDHLGL
jgi:hypothetical protein